MNGGGITVTGWVDDIRTVYSSSRILVAPMVISIGLQNKILQAMAMKIPCVISAMANNALGAEHNKQVLVANTPEEYCRYIQQLLNDKDFYRNIAESAYQFVKSRFTWEENTEKITRVIHALLQEKNDQ
ncbi:MAG: glycosyltransferase [Bacteroidetes bacterium]|nr:glycosyltransferase [Bacteroidota bacterium]